MTYNFDKVINRRNTNSVKWDHTGKDDMMPLWIADMDFEVLPEIKEAIIKRANHPIYGYTIVDDGVYKAIIDFEKRHHDVDIDKEDIILTTGVVPSLRLLLDMFTSSDDKILVSPPIYPPIMNTPKKLEREVVYNSLIIDDNGRYILDFEDIEKKFQNDKEIKVYILCNPHNPTGICYTKEEVEKLVELCSKYDIWLISDEIHGDLIMPGHAHYSALRCDRAHLDKVITMTAPTKTFNLAALKISYILTKNNELADLIRQEAGSIGLSSINSFALEAIKAAYNHGDEWLKECLDYVLENFKFLDSYIKENLPMVKFYIPEATYLGWLNLEAIDLPVDYFDRLKDEAKVEFNNGITFDERCAKYLRINCATTKANLKEGMDRVVKWLKDNNCL